MYLDCKERMSCLVLSCISNTLDTSYTSCSQNGRTVSFSSLFWIGNLQVYCFGSLTEISAEVAPLFFFSEKALINASYNSFPVSDRSTKGVDG